MFLEATIRLLEWHLRADASEVRVVLLHGPLYSLTCPTPQGGDISLTDMNNIPPLAAPAHIHALDESRKQLMFLLDANELLIDYMCGQRSNVISRTQ